MWTNQVTVQSGTDGSRIKHRLPSIMFLFFPKIKYFAICFNCTKSRRLIRALLKTSCALTTNTNNSNNTIWCCCSCCYCCYYYRSCFTLWNIRSLTICHRNTYYSQKWKWQIYIRLYTRFSKYVRTRYFLKWFFKLSDYSELNAQVPAEDPHRSG